MSHTLPVQEYIVPEEHKILRQNQANDYAKVTPPPELEEVKQRTDIPKKDPNYVNKGV